MLSCLQQLCIYIYTEEKEREDKRRAERSVHLIQNLSLLMAGCSPQPSQFTKTAVIFISKVSLHLANDDLLFALSAAEAFVKVQTLKTFNRSINILQPKLFFFFFLVLSHSHYSKFMRRNLICPRNHKLIKTYKLSWRGPPENHPTTIWSRCNTQRWIIIDLFVICHCWCVSVAFPRPPVSTVILLTPVSVALPLISPALLSITL